MRVSINQAERAIALLAVDHGDKECERARQSLERLHVEDLQVMALQGRVDALRKQLKDTKEHVYDWGFDERRALAISLRIFRDKLRALATSEEKLTVDTASTDRKITDIGDFLARLAGQESLFRDDEDDDGDLDTDPPPKLSADQIAEIRHGVEIGQGVD